MKGTFWERPRERIPKRLRSKDSTDQQITFDLVWRAVLLEYIATTLFVFFACGSVVGTQQYGLSTAASNLLAAITQGFAIAVFVYAVAHTSGGHLNPAVTLSFMTSGDVGIARGLAYIFVQIVGGITGAALLRLALPDNILHDLGATALGENVTRGQGFVFEFLITFTLLFTIYGTALHKGSSASGLQALAPLPIGYSITIGVAIAFTVTGGSMNPARSFGPAVVGGYWHNHWVYWVGPFSAALVLGLLERFVKVVSAGKRDVHHLRKARKEHLINQQVKQAAQEFHEETIQEAVAEAVPVVLEPGTEPVAMVPVETLTRRVSILPVTARMSLAQNPSNVPRASVMPNAPRASVVPNVARTSVVPNQANAAARASVVQNQPIAQQPTISPALTRRWSVTNAAQHA